MPISHLSSVSAHGAAPCSQANLAALHAGTTFFQPSFIPPGNSLDQCVNFTFSNEFKNFVNISAQTPALKIIEKEKDYLSACVCKVYDGALISSKNKYSDIFRNVPSNPVKPPSEIDINSVAQISPILKNISDYFFNVFVPEAEKKPRNPIDVGAYMEQAIFLKQEYAYTAISMDVGHEFAQGSEPAINSFYAVINCNGKITGWAAADKRVFDLLKILAIKYFKNNGAEVFVNGERL